MSRSMFTKKTRKLRSDEQKESRVGRLLAPVQRLFRSPSPSLSSSFQQSPQPLPDPPRWSEQPIKARNKPDSQLQSNDLWSKAYTQLPDEYKKDLDKLDKLDVLRKVLATVKQAEEENAAKPCKLKLGNQEIDVREKAQAFIGWLNKFKEIGDIMVQYDPGHAALPWAGVRWILMLVIGDQQKLAAAIVMMEKIAILIGRCTIYEQLYLSSTDIPDIAEEATENLREALLALYLAILQVLSQLMTVFKGKDHAQRVPK